MILETKMPVFDVYSIIVNWQHQLQMLFLKQSFENNFVLRLMSVMTFWIFGLDTSLIG